MRVYEINNQEVTVEKSTLNIVDSANERTTASFVVAEPAFIIEEGMEVKITENDIVLFAGTIESEKETDNDYKRTAVYCTDYSQLIDTRVVIDAFTDTLAGDIVKKFITDVFSQEGISQGIIQDGAEILRAVFPYIGGNEAMNDVADRVGFAWEVDNDKNLNFYDRSTNLAPFQITENSVFYQLQVQKNRKNYRNRQYIRAGEDITQPIIKENPTPKPDGLSRTFVTRFPIATKPQIYIDNVEINQNDIGVNGSDQNKKFYYSLKSNTVTQDTSEAALDTESKIEITYRGFYPIIVVAENPHGIDERIAKEPGSGIYEKVNEERTIDTRDAALEFAQSKLEKYGIIPRIVTFKFYEHGLKGGQLLGINLPNRNLSGDFLIETVTTRDENGLTAYYVKCLDGTPLGGWERFFKDLAGKSTRLAIKENEILVLLNSVAETTEVTETTTDTTFACPIPNEDLYPSENLYPC